MITHAQMYWLVKLDDIRGFVDGIFGLPILAIVAGVLGGVTFTIMYMFAGNGSYEMFSGKTDEQFEDIRQTLWKWRGKCVALILAGVGAAVVLSVTYHLIPTTKQMAAVLVVPGVVNNEKVQTVGNKLYDLAVEWMEELRPAKPEPAKERKQ